jgi:N-acetylmuramoyl-L-alanine amidase
MIAMKAAALAAVVIAGTLPWDTAPAASAAPDIAGKTVFLDPGHAGVNAAAYNSRQVPDGRGGTKDCQTSGTQTADGYAEAALNWDVTLRIRAALTALGVRSAMSRGDNASQGPCIDQRAAAANALAPDAIISIHADGGPPAGRGFHVNFSNPALNAAQTQSLKLATVMRDTLVADGMATANYIGTQGLYGRADLAGLNLAKYPAVLVELGDMRNPAEAAVMETAEGRQRYAAAVVDGIVAYLRGNPG